MTDWLALAQEYVGTPYDEAPCWELLRRVYERGHGITLPEYAFGRTDEEIHPVVRRGLPQWRQVEKPEAGDAVLLWVRRPALPSHVGVYVGDSFLLHTSEATGALLERIPGSAWEKRIAGYYRHESLFAGWTLRVTPHPFAPCPTEITLERGASIHQALIRSGIKRERAGQIRVRIGEELIDPKWWGRVRPRAGIVVDAESIPGDPITLFLAIGGAAGSALIGTSAAVAVPLSIAAGVIGTAAIYAGGYMLATSLSGTPEPPKSEGARGPAQSPEAAGVGNRIEPWGPVPVAYGLDLRVFPPLAAPAYTEIVGGERFWRILLCVAAGRYYIDRTGETGRSGIEVGGVAIEDLDGFATGRTAFEVFDGATYDAATEYEDTVLDAEPAADPRQAAPLGYWRMNGNATSAVGGPTLTASGGVTYGSSITSQAGGSAVFDGSNDYLETTTPPITLAGDWTIKFWMKPDGWGNRTLIESGPGRGVELAQNSDGISIIAPTVNTWTVDLPAVAGPVGRRSRLVALRCRSGFLDLHVDRVRYPLGAASGFLAPTRLTIGARRKFDGTYERFYDGSISELAFYNIALSDDELHLLEDIGGPVPTNPPPGNTQTGSWQTRLWNNSPQEVPINQVIQAATAPEVIAAGGILRSPFITREIPGEVDRLEVEQFFSAGMYRVNNLGERKGAAIGIEIQYRKDGGNWVDAASAGPTFLGHLRHCDLDARVFMVGNRSGNGPAIVGDFLCGAYWNVPLGTGYEIQYRTFNLEGPGNLAGEGNGNNTLQFVGDHNLLCFRGVKRNAKPVRTTGVSYVGITLPVRETGSTVHEISVLVSSMLRTVSGGVLSSDYTVTNNGAWVMLAKLIERNMSNPRPIPAAKIDLDAFEAFAARAKPFNLYQDFRSNVQDDANITGACSFASLGYNGRWTVIEDRAGLPVAQLITNRNSRSLGGVLRRPDLAHGLRVKFIDEDRASQEREILVFDDGYNEDGSDGLTAASKYESIEIRGLTTEAEVREHVRIRLAMTRLRTEEFHKEMMLDAVRVHRGSVAELQDWSALIGQHSGRVTGRTTGGGGTTVTAITVDERIVYVGATNYGLVWRQPDGTVRRADVTNPGAGTSLTITFSSAQPIAAAPAIGDLVVFGERDEETLEVLVRDIVRRGLKAELSLIPYVPEVFDAGEGPVPFDPVVANPIPLVEYNLPPAPVVDRIESDERWLLVTQAGVTPRMRVWVKKGNPRDHSRRAQVRWRLMGGGAAPWIYSEWGNPYPDSLIVGPVETGAILDVQARVAREDGRSSAWSSIITHIVVGTSTPPPDVTEVRVEGDVVIWTYDARNVPDLAGFVVKYAYGQARDPSQWWDGAQRVGGPGAIVLGTSIPASLVPRGQHVSVMVKAVDVAGNESETPALLSFVGRIDARNVIATIHDGRELGWPGWYRNAEVDSGDLAATQTPDDGTQPAFGDRAAIAFPTSATLPAFGALAYPMEYVFGIELPGVSEGRRFWSVGAWTPNQTPPLIEWRAAAPDIAFPGDPTDIAFPGYDRTAFPGDPIWPAFPAELTEVAFPLDTAFPGRQWTEWIGWFGQVASPARGSYQFRIRSRMAPAEWPRLEEFHLYSDVDDLVENLNDVAISAAGSRLPLTKQFSSIDHVSLVLQSIPGQTGRTVELVDKEPQGPMARVRDENGDLVAGTIDAEVSGAPLLL